jgi:hypothetical protein
VTREKVVEASRWRWLESREGSGGGGVRGKPELSLSLSWGVSALELKEESTVERAEPC